MVVYSDLSIGMMFAMFGYIWVIMTPVQDILSMQYSYASAKAAIERLNKILKLNLESNGVEKLSTCDKKLDLKIKNLSFAYTSEKSILRDISLTVPFGQKVALIGASGSGKTTLAQIISGFYEKTSGEIFYNDLSIERIDKKVYENQFF